MQEQLDRTPGVYMRSPEPGRSPHEVDLLWSGSQHLEKEERSPILLVVMGVIIGVIICSAIFFLFFNKPKITIEGSEITDPVMDTALTQPVEVQVPVATAETASTVSTSVGTAAPSQPPAAVVTPAASEGATVSAKKAAPVTEPKKLKTKTYTVKNGDTLEKISHRFYGTANPSLIHKIQSANKLPSADRLSIGQELVIPPKDY